MEFGVTLQNFVDVYKDFISDGKNYMMLALISVFFVAALCGFFAKRLKQPLFLGYIFSGIIFAVLQYAFGSYVDIDPSSYYSLDGALNALADIGVSLLLFSMGIEFSRKDIKPIWGVAVFGSLAQVVFTFFTASGLAYLMRDKINGMGYSASSYFLFGTCFVSTSTAVVLKTLVAKGYNKFLSGRVMIGVSIVQDLTVIPLMLLVFQVSDFSQSGLSLSSFIPLVGSVVFIFVMIIIGKYLFPKILKHAAEQDSSELFLLTVILIALFSGMIADSMHVSFSFGSFLAGIALSECPYGKKTLSELMSVRDIFSMMFFVSIGAMFDVSYLVQHWGLILVMVVATGLSRTVFLAIVTWTAQYRQVIPIAMLFGMFPTSEIAFVVLGIAQNRLPPDCASLILCTVICSMLIGPLINELTDPVYRFLRKTGLMKNTKLRNIVPVSQEISGHVVFIGGSTFLSHFISVFNEFKVNYVIIEPAYDKYEILQKKHYNVIWGDPQQESILNAAGIERAKILVPVSDDHIVRLHSIELARKLNPNIKVVVCAESGEQEVEYMEEKADEIILSKFEKSNEILRRVLLLSEIPLPLILYNMYFIRKDRYQTNNLNKNDSCDMLNHVVWIQVPQKSPITNFTVADVDINKKFGITLAGIMRNRKFHYHISPSDVFYPNDYIAVIGNDKLIMQFLSYVAPEQESSNLGYVPSPLAGV